MRKPKFNLLDGFIVLLLIAAIAGGAYLYLKPATEGDVPQTSSQQSSTAKFQVELVRVEKAIADEFLLAFENGEDVSCGEKERFYAKLANVSATPASRTVINHETATAEKVEDPILFDVILTLETPVTESDNSITAKNTVLRTGSTLAVQCKQCAGYGYIINLELN